MSKRRYFLTELTTVHPHAVPIATMLCRTARIGDKVNRMVNWNEANAKISQGMLIESLVICIICGRKPLWKVEQFWARQDLKAIGALQHDYDGEKMIWNKSVEEDMIAMNACRQLAKNTANLIRITGKI